jgi:hypothetical protein
MCVFSVIFILFYFCLTVDWLPIIRELVAVGVATMNAALAVSLSLTIIALGWIRYRPWLGFSILAMAVVPFVFAKLRGRFGPQPQSTRHRSV